MPVESTINGLRTNPSINYRKAASLDKIVGFKVSSYQASASCNRRRNHQKASSQTKRKQIIAGSLISEYLSNIVLGVLRFIVLFTTLSVTGFQKYATK